VTKYISELDTLRFGFTVAKINNFKNFNDAPLDALHELKQQGVKLVISRVLTSDVSLINKMEDAGFRLKDVQITYNFNLNKNTFPSTHQDDCIYRSFTKNDLPDIVQIATESFKNYGHYSNSEKTKSINSSLIYEDWARRSCLDKNVADHIIIAEVKGVVAGFLSLKIRHENQIRHVAGVMGAVNEAYRQDGIFRGINIASLHWAKRESFERIENNVLITNFPVSKTYINLGFEIIRSETTFHCWLE